MGSDQTVKNVFGLKLFRVVYDNITILYDGIHVALVWKQMTYKPAYVYQGHKSNVLLLKM